MNFKIKKVCQMEEDRFLKSTIYIEGFYLYKILENENEHAVTTD